MIGKGMSHYRIIDRYGEQVGLGFWPPPGAMKKPPKCHLPQPANGAMRLDVLPEITAIRTNSMLRMRVPLLLHEQGIWEAALLGGSLSRTGLHQVEIKEN